jgi:hypothetical protein
LVVFTACGLNDVELGEKNAPGADGGEQQQDKDGGLPASCTKDGWCLLPPVIEADLKAVWVTKPDDVLVVGASGTILHNDGKTWTKMASGTTADLNGVVTEKYSGSYAVGASGTILELEGGAWKAMKSGSSADLFDVWPVKNIDGDIWAIGTNWTILTHSTYGSSDDTWTETSGGSGASFTALWSRDETGYVLCSMGYVMDLKTDIVATNGKGCSGPDPLAVWGTSEDDVHVVGTKGFMMHFDGKTWTEVKSVTDKHLYAVWGSGPNDVYAAGQDGTMLHFDGTSWKHVETGVKGHIYDIHGAGGTVLAVGRDGTMLRLTKP